MLCTCAVHMCCVHVLSACQPLTRIKYCIILVYIKLFILTYYILPYRFFVMGATFVLLATFLYGKPQPRTDTSPMADQTGHVVKTNVVKIS